MTVKNKIDKYFDDRGFQQVNLHMDGMSLNYVGRGQAVSLIWVIDEGCMAGLAPEAYKNYAAKIRETFVQRDYSIINMLTLFLCHEPKAALAYGTEIPFWVVDEKYGRIVIYENMPEDFESIRLPVESMVRVVTMPERDMDTDRAKPSNGARTVNQRGPAMQYLSQVGRRPYFMHMLVIANFIVFFLTDLFGARLGTDSWLMSGAVSWFYVFKKYEYYRLFTCMFLHADISHIIGNMIGLYALGELLERELGHIKFLLLYLLSGTCAGVLASLFYMHRNDYVISIGASGAIFGLMGVFAAYYLFNRNRMDEIGNVRITLFLAYMFYSLFLGSRDEGIDNAAHAFGLISGSVLCLITCLLPKVRFKRKERR